MSCKLLERFLSLRLWRGPYNRLIFVALFLFKLLLGYAVLKAWHPLTCRYPEADLTATGSAAETTSTFQFAYPRQYTHFNYTINHPNACDDDLGSVHVVIMVVSSPANFEARRAIRRTWGSVAKKEGSRIRQLFLMGQPEAGGDLQELILEEDLRYGDILQEDFVDSYFNLTLKSVMMLKWLNVHCPVARFALKIDDDCFLNPINLLTFLTSPEVVESRAVIYGDVHTWSMYRKPHRCYGEKWYVSRREFVGDLFPPYINGVSYLMTRAALPLLYQAALLRPLIRLEDVFVTGICAEAAGVDRIRNGDMGVVASPVLCATLWFPKMITYHGISIKHSEMLWKQIVDLDLDTCQR